MSGVDPSGELPPAFAKAKASDELFWCKQEKTIQGASGQPCCTLSGISTGLIRMEGNFAVVVHGEDECASCFLHYGPSAHRFFATGLEEQHFVSGRTQDRLRKCLRLVAEELTPAAIFVLGACPIEVIGDRFETVVEEIAAEYPEIAFRALHTSGLKVGSQAAMLDWMYSELVALPSLVPTDPAWKAEVSRATRTALDAWLGGRRLMQVVPDAAPLQPAQCLNFLGLPEVEQIGMRQHEWAPVVKGAGLTTVGTYPYGAELDDWRAMGFAAVTFVVDRTMYPKTVMALEARGQTVLEVPLPVGLDQTDRFYQVISEHFGLSLADTLAPARAAAVAALDGFRTKWGPLRMVMGLRMLNDYRTDQVAYQGLGDYAAMAELGFDTTVMVQGPSEKKDRFERLFRAHGITVPFEMFAEPWNLSTLIGGGRYDFAYLADYCRDEARKAGVPMVTSRHLMPYYAGVVQNVAALDHALTVARKPA